jgi:hypothetical protein
MRATCHYGDIMARIGKMHGQISASGSRTYDTNPHVEIPDDKIADAQRSIATPDKYIASPHQ